MEILLTEGIISIKRTGNLYGIASSEYEVTYPDGTTETIWSPPWHEYTEDMEDLRSVEYALKRYIDRKENEQNGFE